MSLDGEWGDDDWGLGKDFNPDQPRDQRGRWSISGTVSQGQTDELLLLAGKRVTLAEKHSWAKNLIVRAGTTAGVAMALQLVGLAALPAWALGIVSGSVVTDLDPDRHQVTLDN